MFIKHCSCMRCIRAKRCQTVHGYIIYVRTCTQLDIQILSKHLTVASLRSSLRMELDLAKEINFIIIVKSSKWVIFVAIQCQLLSTHFWNNKHCFFFFFCFVFSRVLSPFLSRYSFPLAIPLCRPEIKTRTAFVNFISNIDELRSNGICLRRSNTHRGTHCSNWNWKTNSWFIRFIKSIFQC